MLLGLLQQLMLTKNHAYVFLRAFLRVHVVAKKKERKKNLCVCHDLKIGAQYRVEWNGRGSSRVSLCHAVQHTATQAVWQGVVMCLSLPRSATHCNNTLQYRRCGIRGVVVCLCNTLQLTATHYNTLQHTSTDCNTLQQLDMDGAGNTLDTSPANTSTCWKQAVQFFDHPLGMCYNTPQSDTHTFCVGVPSADAHAAIFWITSNPLTTLPTTTCLPSH